MFDLCDNCVRTPYFTRRQFLTRVGMGFGALGLASLLSEDSLFGADDGSAAGPLAPKLPPFPAKAKRVIHIFAAGAPSHVDTWDPKPALAQYDGQPIPGGRGVAMASPFKFQRCGRSGIEVSEVFPKIAEHVDDLAIIRSMYTDIPAHEIATVMMNTGSRQIAKPSLGSWSLYGLGTENQNMPGFISLHSGGGLPPGGTQNWGSAFLPGVYQGTSINTSSDSVDRMIENIRSPYVSGTEQRRQLDLIQQLNELHAQDLQKDAQLEARIQCRPPRPMRSISIRSRPTSAKCTATRRKAARCSLPGDCWSAACGSSRSGPADGTTTRTSTKSSPRPPGRLTSRWALS
jgi:hypothetical protein